MGKQHAKQFTKLKVQFNEPRAAFDAYIAVWASPRGEVVIGAPTMERLSEEWHGITGTLLDRNRVQHVVMTLCDLPEGMMQEARRALGYQEGESADA